MKKIWIVLFLPALFVLASCESEPLGKEKINRDLIEVDSQLFLLMERVSMGEVGEEPLECIDFSYPFALFIFDENGQYAAPTSIQNDEEFSALLGNLGSGYSVSINYPITGTTTAGDLININSNDQLKALIDDCVRNDIQRRCNGTLTECIWEVVAIDNLPNPYVGQQLFVNDNDILQLHTANNIYFGAWISFYIGYELHLNITFVAEDGGEIDTFWNEDWKVITFSETVIDIEAGNKRITIKKRCDDLCEALLFEECELEDSPGFYNFELDSYSVCTAIPSNHDWGSPLLLSYFESALDAQNDMNSISGSNYTNIDNPQTIFVRIEHQETQELLGITQWMIDAIPCN